MFGSQEESVARTHNRLVEGQVFEGRFQILSILGEGGVGVVYKAKQVHMDKTVAIKTLASAMVSDDTSFLRFQQEAKAASSLAHANIIIIHDFGRTADGLAFLVMEYLGNKSLDDLLKRQHQLDLDTFLRIFTQICDGLQHAHKKGIVHRDLKPSNIMLVDDEETSNLVKIVDFGLAKLLSAVDSQQHLTQTGAVLGTPLYMSPEQCRGRQLDHRADIYAVGCMMYSALTGRVPHQGETALNTLMKHMMEPPAPFAVSAPNLVLPPPLEAVIFKALQKDPDLRQQSMAELKTDITNAIYFRHPQVAIPAPAFPETADRATTQGGQNRSVQIPHAFTETDDEKTRVTDPALGQSIQAELQAHSPPSAAPNSLVSQPSGSPANDLRAARPASPLANDSRVVGSPALSVQRPANVGVRTLRQGVAASSTTASTGRIVLISVLATCACLIPTTFGFLFFLNQKQSAPAGTTATVVLSKPSTTNAVAGPAATSGNQRSGTAAPARDSSSDKPVTVAILPREQGLPASPHAVPSRSEKPQPKKPKQPGVAARKPQHLHATANPWEIDRQSHSPQHEQEQRAENRKKGAQFLLLANDDYARRDFTSARQNYQKCLSYEKAAFGAIPRVMIIDIHIIDCLLQENSNPPIEMFKQPLDEALSIFHHDEDTAKSSITGSERSRTVWLPFAKANLAAGRSTNNADYFHWAGLFGKFALESWNGPRKGPQYLDLINTYIQALEQVNHDAADEARRELGVAESPRKKKSVRKTWGKIGKNMWGWR